MDDKKNDYSETLTPEFIKSNRKRRGMTLTDLALLINVNPTTVNFWEKGTCKPRLKYHETLIKILNDTNRNPKTENELSILTPDFIKSNRERLGMTKKELADSCHVSLGAIWRWESGESYPQIRCREPLLDILSRSDPYPSQNTPTKQNLNDLSFILTPKFIKINRERRGMLLKELAKLISVSESSLCSWENGLVKPSLSYHETLLKVLSDPNPFHDQKPEDKSDILTPEFIKTNRIRRGMTQKELAELIHVSTPRISSWEKGKLRPTLKYHETLLKVLSDPNPFHDQKPEDKSDILTPEFIKTNRIRRGMTQKELAELIHVSTPRISSWEKGKLRPTLKYHETLLKVLSDPNPFHESKSSISTSEDIKPKRKRKRIRIKSSTKPFSEANEICTFDFKLSALTPEFIKTNRMRRNMSQKDLAELINVVPSTVCSWEIGRRKVNLQIVPLLYDVLTNPNPYFCVKKTK